MHSRRAEGGAGAASFKSAERGDVSEAKNFFAASEGAVAGGAASTEPPLLRLILARRARLRRNPVLRYLQGPSHTAAASSLQRRQQLLGASPSAENWNSQGGGGFAVSEDRRGLSERTPWGASSAERFKEEAVSGQSGVGAVSSSCAAPLRSCPTPICTEAYYAEAAWLSALATEEADAERPSGVAGVAQSGASSAVAAAAAKEDSLQWCLQQLLQVFQRHPREAAEAAALRGQRPMLHQAVVAQSAAESRGVAGASGGPLQGANPVWHAGGGGGGGVAGNTLAALSAQTPPGFPATHSSAGGSLSGKENFGRWLDVEMTPPPQKLAEILVVVCAAVKVHIAELVAFACREELPTVTLGQTSSRTDEAFSQAGGDRVQHPTEPSIPPAAESRGSASGFSSGERESSGEGGFSRVVRVLTAQRLMEAARAIPPL